MIRISSLVISLTLFAAAAQSAEMPHTISVGGTGSVAVRPDMARVNIAIEERDESLATAQRAVADATERVMEVFDDLDIEERHVDTTGATVQPNYRWNRTTEEQELVGYIVRRQIDVEVRELDVLGKLIDGAVRAGANQVSPPVLDSSRRREVYREALGGAVQDARNNAEVLAASLDVDLGSVVQVSAGQQPPIAFRAPRAGMAALAMAEGDASAATYSPGEMRLEANVFVVFAIDD